MELYILYRVETNDFDMVRMTYGYFSTLEAAEAARVKAETIMDLYCLDEVPNKFCIEEVRMNEIYLRPR